MHWDVLLHSNPRTRKKTALPRKRITSIGTIVKTTGPHSTYGSPYSGKVILIVFPCILSFAKKFKAPSH